MGIEFEGIIPKMETHMEKKKENEMGTGIIEWLFLVPQVYASKSQRCNFKTAGDYIAIYCTPRNLWGLVRSLGKEASPCPGCAVEIPACWNLHQ